MQKSIYFSVILATLGTTSPVFASKYVVAIQDFCTAKSKLLVTDSRETCIANAKYNARGYTGILKIAKDNLENQELVNTQIRDLQGRLRSQASIAGLNVSAYLGTDEIMQSLDLALATNNSKVRNKKELRANIVHAMAELKTFESQVK